MINSFKNYHIYKPLSEDFIIIPSVAEAVDQQVCQMHCWWNYKID